MNKILSLFLVLLIIVVPLCGCKEATSRTFFAMDTIITLKADNKNAVDLIYKSTLNIDKILSFYNKDSSLYKLNKNKKIKANNTLLSIIKTSKKIGECTGGAFNITLGNVSKLYDFNKETVPSTKSLHAALKTVGLNNIIIKNNYIYLKNNTSIDLGGIAKGYALNNAIKILKEQKVKNAYLNFGGSIYYLSNTKKEVGIKKPFTKDEIIATLLVNNEAVVTAGNYERSFKKNGKLVHHILNNKGLPQNNDLNSVTVLNEDATVADAYSTALFVMGYKKAVSFCKKNNISAVFVLKDNSVKISNTLEYKNNKIVIKE